MSDAPLRVGVVGLGVGRRHMEGFADHPECSVVAVADRRSEARSAIATDHPDLAVVATWAELLDRGLDAVAIASHDDDHAAQVVEALDAGLHVFCEKPLCRTEDEVREVRVAAAARPEAVVASNLVLRAAPLWRRLRREIASGALGTVYSVDADYLYGRLHKITDGWRGQVAGYSVMLGGGIHMVDLAMGLLGERPVGVVGAGSDVATRDTGFAENDFSAAIFRFPSGAIGRVTANFACAHRHQHAVRVFGTDGTVLVDDLGARRYRERDPGSSAEWLTDPPLPAHKGALIAPFVDAVRGRDHDLPGLDHELSVVKACLAADRAAASGETAVIPQAIAEGIDHM